MLRRGDDFAEQRQFEGLVGEACKIARGGDVFFIGQAIGVFVTGILHAKLFRFAIHGFDEAIVTFSLVLGIFLFVGQSVAEMFADGDGRIVARGKHEAVEKFADGQFFAGLYFGGGTGRFIGAFGEGDDFIEDAGILLGEFTDEVGRHDFGGTGRFARAVFIVAGEEPAGFAVDDGPTFGGDERGAIERIGGCLLLRFGIDDGRLGGGLLFHDKRAERFPGGRIDDAGFFETGLSLELFNRAFGFGAEVAVGADRSAFQASIQCALQRDDELAVGPHFQSACYGSDRGIVFGVEVFVSGKSDVGTEHIAFVVVGPALVFVVVREDAVSDGAVRCFDNAAIGADDFDGTGFVGDFGIAWQVARDVRFVGTGKEVRHHFFGGVFADDFSVVDLFGKAGHFASGGAAQAVLLAAFKVDRSVAAEGFGVDLGFGVAKFGHKLACWRNAELIEHHVGGRVVGIHDHEVDGIAERNFRARREVVGEDAGAGDFILGFELEHVVEVELAIFHGIVRGDHDGELDEACRGHGGIGVVLEGFARFEVFDEDGHVALVGFDERE